MKPVPLFLDKGKGSRVWDVDGNQYIDYILGYGPLILGHSHPELLEYVSKAMQKGQQFGMQHQVPCADKVAFSGSGTEAVMLAIRLARAFTGKQKVVRFEGHYHGWSDLVFTSFPTLGAVTHPSAPGTQGQSPLALEEVLTVPWNDPEALITVMEEHGHEIAAVITEPVLCNSGCISPSEGYLELIRKLTKEHQAVFILDEVITGFPLTPGGAQERFGIAPDLATMGKAIAGGFALSCVAGRKEIMDLIAEGKAVHLGTLNGNMVSVSAGIATLNLLNRNGAEAYKKLESVSEALTDGLRELLVSKEIPHVINRIGAVFHLMFTDLEEVTTYSQFMARDSAACSAFAEAALQEGVLLRPSGLWYVSMEHTMEDVEETLARLNKAIDRMQAAKEQLSH